MLQILVIVLTKGATVRIHLYLNKIMLKGPIMYVYTLTLNTKINLTLNPNTKPKPNH